MIFEARPHIPQDDADAPLLEDLQKQFEHCRLVSTGRPAVHQVGPGLRRGLPAQGERRSGAPTASQTVIQRVEIPAEVSAGTVDDFTDRAIEAVHVHDPAAIQCVHPTGRRVGFPLTLKHPGPQRDRQPRSSICGGNVVPEASAIQETRMQQIPHTVCSRKCLITPQRQCEIEELSLEGGRLEVDERYVVDEVGPHGRTHGIQELKPGVCCHGSTAANVLKALAKAALWRAAG